MEKDAELIGVYGMRGSGKSTLTKGLIKSGYEKILAFDTIGEYGGRGWVQCKTIKEVVQAMGKRWKSGFKISFLPTAGAHIEDLHELASMCFKVQQPYRENRDHRKLMMVVEEANMSMPNQAFSRKYASMQSVILQGRHWGIEAIGVSQRPALLSSDFRGNTARTYVFTLANQNDRVEIAKVIGRQHLPMLNSMQRFEFIEIENGNFRRGKTSRTGKISYVRTD